MRGGRPQGELVVPAPHLFGGAEARAVGDRGTVGLHAAEDGPAPAAHRLVVIAHAVGQRCEVRCLDVQQARGVHEAEAEDSQAQVVPACDAPAEQQRVTPLGPGRPSLLRNAVVAPVGPCERWNGGSVKRSALNPA